jgi:hypothetical protein
VGNVVRHTYRLVQKAAGGVCYSSNESADKCDKNNKRSAELFNVIIEALIPTFKSIIETNHLLFLSITFSFEGGNASFTRKSLHTPGVCVCYTHAGLRVIETNGVIYLTTARSNVFNGVVSRDTHTTNDKRGHTTTITNNIKSSYSRYLNLYVHARRLTPSGFY